MKTDILKALGKSTPYWVKKILSTAIRNRLIKNPVFQETLTEIDLFNHMNADEQNQVQLEKLKDQLIYAYQHTRYYNKTFDDAGFNPFTFRDADALTMLPIVTRDLVTQNHDDFISDEALSYYHSQTGGSTGTPFQLELSMDSLYKEKAFIYKTWEKIGYNYLQSRLFTLRAPLEYWKHEKFRYNPVYNEVLVSPLQLSNHTIKDYVKVYNSFGAEFIHGYPSAIRRFCQLLKEEHLADVIKVKGVMFISENVYDSDLAFIESILKTKIVSFYGHTERSVFAEQVNGISHFNNLYGYTELIPVQWAKDAYDIVCTGFLNRRMPLIRYQTGDMARLENDCLRIDGHSEREILIGKKSDIVMIHTLNYDNALFKDFGIHTFQFIQDKPGHVYVHIVSQDLDQDKLLKLNKSMSEKIQDIIDFEIKVVDNVMVKNNGKYNRIIQNLNTKQYLYHA